MGLDVLLDRLISRGLARGYLTFEELTEELYACPDVGPEEIDQVILRIYGAGIELLDQAPAPPDERDLRAQGLTYLRLATDNPKAEFRQGQWEAIEALVGRANRVLVVQRTGWGKSLVYFIATKLFRDQGKGPALLISPLLALMRDQEMAASRVGLNVARIDSTNTKDWPELRQRLLEGESDLLLVSPERLGNEDFLRSVLIPIAPSLSLLVVDEAHCISDWGHDFRPDYRRIGRVLQRLPSHFPVLATTATANSRVVNDVGSQLGSNVEIQRGPLTRASLRLSCKEMPDRATRLVWLSLVLPRLEGSGIIYTLTVRDTELVSDWLQSQGIDALPYSGGLDSAIRIEREQLLRDNEVKALVATSALGMGFDKPDLRFVIHYQTPQSVVHYYQQVGRAGRAVEEARAVLLHGHEDEDIVRYFIECAFPSEETMQSVLDCLEGSGEMTASELESELNMKKGLLAHALKLLTLDNPPPVVKVGSSYRRTDSPYELNRAQVERLTKLRWDEWDQMKEYLGSQDCLMQFLARALSDTDPERCGRCSNCTREEVKLNPRIDPIVLNRANRFLKRSEKPIQPRKLWPKDALIEFRGRIDPPNQEGRVLVNLHGSGWAEMARADLATGVISQDLVDAMADMIERWGPDPEPEWVTCIPSLRRDCPVRNFADDLAEALGLPFYAALVRKLETEPQSLMQNSFHQATNLEGAFEIFPSQMQTGPVLLVDDVIGSGWTLTVAGALLHQAGASAVIPVVLADRGVQ